MPSDRNYVALVYEYIEEGENDKAVVEGADRFLWLWRCVPAHRVGVSLLTSFRGLSSSACQGQLRFNMHSKLGWKHRDLIKGKNSPSRIASSRGGSHSGILTVLRRVIIPELHR